MARCAPSRLAPSDRDEGEGKTGFSFNQASFGYRHKKKRTKQDKKQKQQQNREQQKLTKLFAVGAEAHGGDRGFVTFKITFQNRVLLGWKVVKSESRCGIRNSRGSEVNAACHSPSPGPLACLPPRDRRGPPAGSSVGSEGGAGITSGVTGSGTAPATPFPTGGAPSRSPPSPTTPGSQPGDAADSRAL